MRRRCWVLATDDSRFVTGHVFYVDGGAHLG